MSKKSLNHETIEKILDLNSSGMLNRDIGRQLDIHHTTVSYHLRKNNKNNNWANQNIDFISNTEAKCIDCGLSKSINEFWYKKLNYEFRFAYCSKCREKRYYLNLNSSIEKFLNNKWGQLKNRAKRTRIPFDFSKEQFIHQYKIQGGLCFYTDDKMICEVGSGVKRNSFSVDKIVPEKGYIYGNVVFSCLRINACKQDLSLDEIKQWMPEWYSRIENYLKL